MIRPKYYMGYTILFMHKEGIRSSITVKIKYRETTKFIFDAKTSSKEKAFQKAKEYIHDAYLNRGKK